MDPVPLLSSPYSRKRRRLTCKEHISSIFCTSDRGGVRGSARAGQSMCHPWLTGPPSHGLSPSHPPTDLLQPSSIWSSPPHSFKDPFASRRWNPQDGVCAPSPLKFHIISLSHQHKSWKSAFLADLATTTQSSPASI